MERVVNLRTRSGGGSAVMDELRLIPAVAWLLAGLWVLIFYGLLLPVFLKGAPREPNDIVVPVMTFVGFADALWLLLVFYVNADAARRRMGRLWPTLLVIFVPLLGFIIYFLARRALAHPCPSCGARARPDFAFCTGCGHSLASVCTACKSPVESGWKHCPACGAAEGDGQRSV